MRKWNAISDCGVRLYEQASIESCINLVREMEEEESELVVVFPSSLTREEFIGGLKQIIDYYERD